MEVQISCRFIFPQAKAQTVIGMGAWLAVWMCGYITGSCNVDVWILCTQMCGFGMLKSDVWILCIWMCDTVWRVVWIRCGVSWRGCVDTVYMVDIYCGYGVGCSGVDVLKRCVWPFGCSVGCCVVAVCIRCGCGAGCCGQATAQLKNVASAKQHS
jgi:hypothetical protein